MRTIVCILACIGGLAVLAVVAGLVFSSLSGVRASFDREVRDLAQNEPIPAAGEPAAPTEAELAALPAPVRRFLGVSGYDRYEKIGFLHARYQARMNLKGMWFPIDCEQYNSIAQSTRIWYARINILPFLWVEGRHIYANGRAQMLIKFGPVTIVDIKTPELANADMITFFNDIAFFMPNALINPGISWRTENDNNVIATFENAGFRNSARLSFDQDGMLINFVTDTRGKLDGDHLVDTRWATPITGWRVREGRREAVEGLALYYETSGTAPYIRFEDPAMVLEYNRVPR